MAITLASAAFACAIAESTMRQLAGELRAEVIVDSKAMRSDTPLRSPNPTHEVDGIERGPYLRVMAKSLVDLLVLGTDEEREDWLRRRRDDVPDLSRREIEGALIELSALTRFLLQRLEAAGLADRSQLTLTVEPTVEAAETYRGASEGPIAKVPAIRCASCRAIVPRTRSFVSARGEVCANCQEELVAREEEERRSRES